MGGNHGTIPAFACRDRETPKSQSWYMATQPGCELGTKYKHRASEKHTALLYFSVCVFEGSFF
jgi:hypothetical protein